MPSANGHTLLSCGIVLQERGAWQADFEADIGDEPDTTAFDAGDDGRAHVTLEHEGAAFAGTVVRGSKRGGRFEARIVGGAGGLDLTLPAKSYLSAAGVKLGQILSDIARETGETLSATIDPAVLDLRLSRWTRAAVPARKAIKRVAKKLRLAWRVRRDGTLWVGVDAFADAGVDAVVMDTRPADGTLELAAPEGGPGPLLLDPGTTFEGQRILEVEHKLTGSSFRTEARQTTMARAFEGVLAPLQQEIDYSRVYAARVVSQHPDGTLELMPDDPAIAGTGLDKVPILLGIPGSVTVPVGARCTVMFEGGDPESPRALLWSTALLTLLSIGAGSQFVALANLVDAGFAQVRSEVNAFVTLFSAHIHSGVTTGGGSSGPPATPATPIGAVPTTASSKLKSE